MKTNPKTLFLLLILLVWATSSSAQIMRAQADAIVLNYIQTGNVTQPYHLYVNDNAPNETGISITMSTGETVKAKYACMVYYLNESESAKSRYLFVKEDNGSLLEIIANNDLGPGDLASSWTALNLSSEFAVEDANNNKSLYPNPVDDWLTLPCTGDNSRVEIYDLKGTCLLSGTLSDKDACRLDVSFLSAGIYLVKVGGETYKVIKN